MSDLARYLAGDNYFTRSASGLKRGLSALADSLVARSNEGTENMQAALSGVRVKPGAILTDAGYVMPDASGQADFSQVGLEREPDVLRALELFGGATPAKDMSRGITAVFAGTKAKTANLAMRELAEKMEKDGSAREAIWEATGWFKAPDGQWKWEINDSNSGVGVLAKTAKDTDLGDVFAHAELERAYPYMPENIGVTTAFHPNMGRGAFKGNADGGRLYLQSSNTMDDNRSVMLHELQHAVQEHENFARGGTWGPEYDRLAGEVEARAVQARMNLTPEQRATRPPWLDYDVPEEQQIVRMLLGQSDADSAAMGPVKGATIAAKSGSVGKVAADAAHALPMDEASRMARAAEMGFTTDAFHGRGGDYQSFDKSYLGSNTGAADTNRGFWFGDDPKIASDFSFDHELPNVVPAKIKLDNPYVLTDSRLMKIFDGDMESAIEHAYKKGKDGVVVVNGEGFGKNYVVFDPKNIRSRFAAFDPARVNEADLLASRANLGPIVNALLQGYDR